MPRLLYDKPKRGFRATTLNVIHQANEILDEYEELGYDLTLRQLYYQFVSRGLIANRQSEYNKLGSIVNDGRLAGMIDWDHIVDRTRNLRELNHWDTPQAMIDEMTKRYFNTPKWSDQPYYIEVWIEKDALVGVIERVCQQRDVPFFSCRGYTSQSEMWGAAQRIGKQVADGKKIRILHLGDHDPSGLDMTRDIEDRLAMFTQIDFLRGRHLEKRNDDSYEERREWMAIEDSKERADEADRVLAPFRRDGLRIDRLALNMDQIDEYDPPPNPAKLTDSRGRGYVEEHGHSSWELDALPPDVLGGLIEGAIDGYLDVDAWNAAVEREKEMRGWLQRLAGADLKKIVASLDGESE